MGAVNGTSVAVQPGAPIVASLPAGRAAQKGHNLGGEPTPGDLATAELLALIERCGDGFPETAAELEIDNIAKRHKVKSSTLYQRPYEVTAFAQLRSVSERM